MEKLKTQLELQQSIINNLDKEVEKLKSEKDVILRLAVENSNANEYCLQELEKEIENLKNSLKPFNDSYFKGLSYQHIADLAKKSIRITSDSRHLTHLLEDVYENYDLDEKLKKQIKLFLGVE